MPVPKKILTFLDKNLVKYTILDHKLVYTAFDLSQTLKVSPQQISKTIVIKTDKEYILAVLSAAHYINLAKLTKILKIKRLAIVNEKTVSKIFKIKPGTITPFGKLYKIKVYLDKTLLKSKNIITQSGSLKNSINFKPKDFLKITNGEMCDFSSKKR